MRGSTKSGSPRPPTSSPPPARTAPTPRSACSSACRIAPETATVTLHGDANLRNALQLAGGRVALLDLEHLSRGPAEADLGQVLAALLASRTPGAKTLLAGYGRPVDRHALRWHTAASILARIALPAISRYRPAQLAHLDQLLEAATNLVTPVAV